MKSDLERGELAYLKGHLAYRKTEKLMGILKSHASSGISRVLVVGCGSGVEAAIIKKELGCEVIGIDVNAAFDSVASASVQLQVGDATALDFPDGRFDCVYSYHVLEHIPNYNLALREMCRVLSPGGIYCIGTPNRSRLIGYLGSNHATFLNKIAYNFADWRARMQGRFRNEDGAHAGFTAQELSDALLSVFSTATDVSLEYYLSVYQRRSGAVMLLHRTRTSEFLFPAVYFVGRP